MSLGIPYGFTPRLNTSNSSEDLPDALSKELYGESDDELEVSTDGVTLYVKSSKGDLYCASIVGDHFRLSGASSPFGVGDMEDYVVGGGCVSPKKVLSKVLNFKQHFGATFAMTKDHSLYSCGTGVYCGYTGQGNKPLPYEYYTYEADDFTYTVWNYTNHQFNKIAEDVDTYSNCAYCDKTYLSNTMSYEWIAQNGFNYVPHGLATYTKNGTLYGCGEIGSLKGTTEFSETFTVIPTLDHIKGCITMVNPKTGVGFYNLLILKDNTIVTNGYGGEDNFVKNTYSQLDMLNPDMKKIITHPQNVSGNANSNFIFIDGYGRLIIGGYINGVIDATDGFKVLYDKEVVVDAKSYNNTGVSFVTESGDLYVIGYFSDFSAPSATKKIHTEPCKVTDGVVRYIIDQNSGIVMVLKSDDSLYVFTGNGVQATTTTLVPASVEPSPTTYAWYKVADNVKDFFCGYAGRIGVKARGNSGVLFKDGTLVYLGQSDVFYNVPSGSDTVTDYTELLTNVRTFKQTGVRLTEPYEISYGTLYYTGYDVIPFNALYGRTLRTGSADEARVSVVETYNDECYLWYSLQGYKGYKIEP